MKLYATVTSERASKGQGGNDYLNIIVQDENKAEIARLVVTNEDNGVVISYDYDEDSVLMERWKDLELAKGNKQKGELKASDICPRCDIPFGDCDC